jgi:hypothetical protein
MSAWQGTLQFDNGVGLVTKMDYAVYAPGTFGGSVPTNEYVYAYQVFQISTSNLTMASVGILEGSGAANAQTNLAYGVSGGVMPAAGFPQFTGNSFIAWFNPQLSAGQYSVVLLFTSPNAPTRTDASVMNSGKSSQKPDAPTPLPEPATLVLLGLSGLAVICKRRGV